MNPAGGNIITPAKIRALAQYMQYVSATIRLHGELDGNEAEKELAHLLMLTAVRVYQVFPQPIVDDACPDTVEYNLEWDRLVENVRLDPLTRDGSPQSDHRRAQTPPSDDGYRSLEGLL